MSATLIAGPFYAEKETFAKEVVPWLADLEAGKGMTNFIHWIFPAMPIEAAAQFSGSASETSRCRCTNERSADAH